MQGSVCTRRTSSLVQLISLCLACQILVVDAQTCGQGHKKTMMGCQDCPPGSYQDSDSHTSDDCKLCEKGKTSTYGAPNCTVCPSGKYTDGDETNDVRPYNGGSEISCCLNKVAVRVCEDCPAGKYNDKPGLDATDHQSCSICPSGKVSHRSSFN